MNWTEQQSRAASQVPAWLSILAKRKSDLELKISDFPLQKERGMLTILTLHFLDWAVNMFFNAANL